MDKETKTEIEIEGVYSGDKNDPDTVRYEITIRGQLPKVAYERIQSAEAYMRNSLVLSTVARLLANRKAEYHQLNKMETAGLLPN